MLSPTGVSGAPYGGVMHPGTRTESLSHALFLANVRLAAEPRFRQLRAIANREARPEPHLSACADPECRSLRELRQGDIGYWCVALRPAHGKPHGNAVRHAVRPPPALDGRLTFRRIPANPLIEPNRKCPIGRSHTPRTEA
jgi:hypothetical protein